VLNDALRRLPEDFPWMRRRGQPSFLLSFLADEEGENTFVEKCGEIVAYRRQGNLQVIEDLQEKRAADSKAI
jgi:hypothetical protein